jgi:GTP-binding protein EngB required for normal cell division
MSDFWWKVQQDEEQEWQFLLEMDREYQQWLDKIDKIEGEKNEISEDSAGS